MKIKANDNVIVISGKDKGKTGKVLEAFPRENKVLIAGVNSKKVRTKSREKGKQGETIDKNMPIHVSNVMLLDPKGNKPTRIGYKMDGDKKVRVAKKSGTTLK